MSNQQKPNHNDELAQTDEREIGETTLNLNIGGMTCSNCALKISSKLQSLPGITEADVILPTESAKVKFKKDQIEIAAILDSIEDIGYHASLSRLTLQIEEARTEEKGEFIKDFLKQVPGVAQITFQVDQQQFKITFNSGELSEHQIIREIRQQGYTPHKTKGVIEQEKETVLSELNHKKKLLLFSFLFSIPTVLLNEFMMFTDWFHSIMPIMNWVLFILATIIQITIGRIFYVSAYKALRSKSDNMDILISLGSGTAYLYSVYATITGRHMVFFGDSVLILSFILLGKYFEALAKGRTSSALQKLMELGANSARVLRNGREFEIEIDEVDTKEILIVKPGEKIPLDGTIIEGISRIDEAMITGESIPVKKQPGDIVIGGTINQNGLLKVRVDKIGSDTMLNRIIELVKNAQTQKAPLQRLADKVSRIFVPLVIFIAILTFTVWYWGEGFAFEDALLRFVTVVVISCPCAFGLAIPTAIMVGTGQGAKAGILIKGGESLEAIHKVNYLVFDKTGTLTIGRPQVTDLVPLGGNLATEVIYYASSLEQGSEHPLGKAILEYALDQKITLGHVANFENMPGFGIAGEIDGRSVFIGNLKYATNATSNEALSMADSMIQALQDQGKTIVVIIVDHQPIGIIGISDKIKAYAPEVIAELHNLGIQTYMITGDQQRTAEAIANQIGIGNFYAEVLPAQKLERIAELQSMPNAVVAMVGDGINDAPALTKANVGIAVGSGTDIAMESADIVLIQGDLRNILAGMVLSKKTYQKMIQNLFWAFIYNVIGIPFAAGVFYYSLGFFLPPAAASLFMAFSSVSVVTSALLLGKLNLISIKEKMQLQTPTRSKTHMEMQKSDTGDFNRIEGPHLECPNDGYQEMIPEHCGRPMISHEGQLVCWMNLDPQFGGIKCGQQEFPKCPRCNHTLEIKE